MVETELALIPWFFLYFFRILAPKKSQMSARIWQKTDVLNPTTTYYDLQLPTTTATCYYCFYYALLLTNTCCYAQLPKTTTTAYCHKDWSGTKKTQKKLRGLGEMERDRHKFSQLYISLGDCYCTPC